MFRMPTYLYRLRLGWLLGHRILLLGHVGRVSGQPRQTVLEILEHDPAQDSYVVASGWGPTAQWYRNVVANPEVTGHVGIKRIPMTAMLMSSDEGSEAFVRYAFRHRVAARYIWAPMLGRSVDGSVAEFKSFAYRMAFVRLVPR
jgi:deazaflavin-dependent oxidoreductase (nitroreductase family)